MARSDSVTSSHAFFGHTVVIIRLSRSYNNQVKNTVTLKVNNRCLSKEIVSTRRCNFGHSCSLYIVFSDLLYKKLTLLNINRDTIVEGSGGQNCIFGRFSPGEKLAIL